MTAERDDDEATIRQRPSREATIRQGPSRDAATVDLTGSDAARAAVDDRIAESAFAPHAERFVTRGELGRGGMGRVDDAFDRALGRAVAIKHVLAHSEVELARFEREARITARLEHPGIVPIYDTGRGPDGTPYYVMRRLEGRPLDKMIAGARSLAERLALIPSVLAACDATAFAHARGIVHRDIKPANILVGPFGETLLIDWGLARELSEHDDGGTQGPSQPALTHAGAVAGTPGFMAPEQARGDTIDARADVFALGVTLFYVLAGKLPWSATSATGMIAAAAIARAPDWALLPREVPGDLRAILVKAMAAYPIERYADAGELATDLRQFTLGKLVAAYDYGGVARLVRFARRNRAAVAVAGASAVVLSVVIALSLRRIVDERDQANVARALAEHRERETAAMADRLIVQNARALVDTDPVAAIAALRRLPATSTRWDEVWAVAATAWTRGIEFGFAGGPGIVKIASDNRTAFHITSDSGRIAVLDLVTRSRREVAEVGRIRAAAWLDNGNHIVCATKGGVVLVEVGTGRQRTLPLDVTSLYGGGANKVWLGTDDHRLLELAAGTSEPREIATGVDDYAVSDDLTEAALRRGTTWELWRAGRTYPVFDDPDRALVGVVVRDGVIAGIIGDEIRAWNLRDGRMVESGRWPSQRVRGLAVLDTQVYAIAQDGVAGLYKAGSTVLHRFDMASTVTAQAGFMVLGSAGDLLVRDQTGWVRLGRRRANFVRGDFSRDARFAVALSTNGDVHAWDLGALRPQVVPIAQRQTPAALTAQALWTLKIADSVSRYDLATGVGRVVVSGRPVQGAWVDRLDRFAVVKTELSDAERIWIYDVAADRILDMKGAVDVAFDEEGVVVAHADGVLGTWRPGQVRGKVITTLSEKPDWIAATTSHVIAVLASGRTVRIETATGVIAETALPNAPTSGVIESNGRAWLAARGELWSWGVGEPAVRKQMPEPVYTLSLARTGIVVQTANSLVHIADTGERVIPVSATAHVPMNGDRVVVVTAHGAVGIADFASGTVVELPWKVSSGIPKTDGERIGYMSQGNFDEVGLWTVPVPSEPEALRRWLADVTNAVPVPDSDAIAWP